MVCISSYLPVHSFLDIKNMAGFELKVTFNRGMYPVRRVARVVASGAPSFFGAWPLGLASGVFEHALLRRHGLAICPVSCRGVREQTSCWEMGRLASDAAGLMVILGPRSGSSFGTSLGSDSHAGTQLRCVVTARACVALLATKLALL